MPKFNVLMTRDVTESCVISVEAETEAEAIESAGALLSMTDAPGWSLDDASATSSHPYATSCDEVDDDADATPQKFTFTVGLNARAYGTVAVSAKSLHDATGRLNHNFIADNFRPKGTGQDDLDLLNAMDVAILDWSNEDGDEGDLDLRLDDPEGEAVTIPRHGGGDPEASNDARASWAELALLAFRFETGADECEALPDLLCDLMHYAHATGRDFSAELRQACRHFRDETLITAEDA